MAKKNNLNLFQTNVALVLTAMVVGLIVSIIAQFFSLTAKWVFKNFQSGSHLDLFQLSLFSYDINILPLISCLLAGILVCVLIYFFQIDRWHGPADTIYAAHQKAGTLDIKKGFLSTLAAFFSISGGASVGIYGPLVHFGGTLGAFLRRRTFMPDIPHDIIIGAGVAAAISAGFSSPIAGIIFAHEVVLRHFSMRALSAISLASVTASFLAQEINLVTPNLRFDEVNFTISDSIPGLVFAGICSAIVAYIFMKSLLLSTKISNSSGIDFKFRPLIPALICGAFGIFIPGAIGLGSETIINVITENNTIIFLLLILICKIFLSSLCIGFGLFGGVFSPALLIGACTGALLYNVPFLGIEDNLSTIFAVSAMAAVSSSVIGGPITAIVLIFELTGSYNYAIASILPIALSNLITYLIFGSSFFDAQLKLRKIPMGSGREHILLSQTSIEKYIDKNYLFLNKEISVENALKKFSQNNVTEAYFYDINKIFLGKLKLVKIIGKKNDKAIKYIEKKFIKLDPSNNIFECIKILSNFVGESIPVIEKKNKFIGIISENDILKAYDQISHEIRNIEKS